MTDITLPRAELQQVLEALEEINKLSIGENAICLPAEIDGAITALRDRLAERCVCGEPDTPGTHRTDGPCLAEQPEQEPVAWIDAFGNVFPLGAQRGPKHLNEPMKPLYTAPTPRKPLTKDEIRDGARKTDPAGEDLCPWSFECGVRFAEDAHGIKGET